MSDAILNTQDTPTRDAGKPTDRQAAPSEKPTWETPKLEDVSQQVMAQPYIRFT